MESFSKKPTVSSIKQITQIKGYEKEYGLDVGSKHNNNYSSCYAIPIGTPKPIEKKGHNGCHESHIKK